MENFKAFPSHGIKPKQLKELLTVIQQNNVCVIGAPTGAAKSTLIPEAIARFGATVCCAQPTNAAVSGLHGYMSGLLEGEMTLDGSREITVGYEREGEVNYTIEKLGKYDSKEEFDSIVYCTTGHLRSIFSGYFKNGELVDKQFPWDIIIYDEAHNSTIEGDIVMGLWIKAHESVSNGEYSAFKLPRLVIMSATLTDTQLPFNLKDSQRYNVDLPMKKVVVEYHDKDYGVFERNRYPDLAKIIYGRHVDIPLSPKEDGNKWAVFCPGKFEISQVSTTLQAMNDSLPEHKQLEIIEAYSGMDNKVLQRLFEPAPVGKRIVIISTNIIESSVTISDLDAVFDTMVEKYNVTSETGGEKLITAEESKSSADQRKGRVGRTREGYCFRLCTKESYEGYKEQRPSELARSPLEQVFLSLVRIGISPEYIFGPRLSAYAVENTYENLLKHGLLVQKKKSGKVFYATTEKGDFIGVLKQLSINSASLLWEWMNMEQRIPVFPCVVVACLIDSVQRGYVWYPEKERGQTLSDYTFFKTEYFNKLYKPWILNIKRRGRPITQLDFYLEMWEDYKETFTTLKPDFFQLKKWCGKYSIRFPVFQGFIRTTRQIVDTIRRSIDIELVNFNCNKVMDIMESEIFPKVYSNEVFESLSGDKNVYIDDKGIGYSLELMNNFNPYLRNPNSVYCMGKFVIVQKTGQRRLISFYHPAGEDYWGESFIEKYNLYDEETKLIFGDNDTDSESN